MRKTVLAILLAISFDAHAGVVNSGGGKGVICRNPVTSAETIQVLEIYEAKLNSKWAPLKVESTFEKQLDVIGEKLARLHQTNRDRALAMLEFTLEKFVFLPEGASLRSIDDAKEEIKDSNCRSVQLAHYKSPEPGVLEDDKIYIDSVYWNKLDAFNQVALLAHEFIYQILRASGDSDSRAARRVVKNLMSNWEGEAILEGVPAQGALKCHGFLPQTQFYVYPSVRGGVHGSIVQFDFLGGVPLLSKATAFLPNADARFFDSRNTVSSARTLSGTLQSKEFSEDLPIEFIRIQTPYSDVPRILIRLTSQNSTEVQSNITCRHQ